MMKFVIVNNYTHIVGSRLMLLMAVLLLGFQAIAQERWAYVSGDAGTDYAADLIQTIDRGFLSCGTVEVAGDGQIHILKVDSNGYGLWEKSINLDGLVDLAVTAIQTADTGYAIFGRASGTDVPFLMKLDEQGDSIWSTLPSVGSMVAGSGFSAKGSELADGSFVIYSITDVMELYKTKIAADGSFISTELIPGIIPIGFSAGTLLTDAVPTADGGFALTGSTGDGIAQKGFIWKFDNNADSVWSYVFDTADVNIVYGITETADGSFLTTGVAQSPSTSAMTRVDAGGTHLWSAYYTDPVNFVMGRDIAERNDGSIVMVQVLFDVVDDSTLVSELLQYDATGIFLDQILITGGISSTNITKVISTNDGGFAIGGDLKNSPLIGNEDVFLARSSFDGLLPECIFNCVWPGDGNNDGFVDMDDLLLLGLEYQTATGTIRPDVSTDWYGHDASDWVDTTSTGLNLKFVDTDGNGLLEDVDTSGISMNYGKGHPINVLRPATAGGSLELHFDDEVATPLGPGTHSIPIILDEISGGDVTIYGFRFAIQYEGNIDPATVTLEFDDSWMGDFDTELLSLFKNNKAALRIEGGLTRKDQTNVVGDGAIGSVKFVVIDNIVGRGEAGLEGEVKLTIVDAVGITADATEELITGEEATFDVYLPTGLQPILESVVNIYPNPLTGVRLFYNGLSEKQLNAVSIMDLAGREIAQLDGTAIHNEYIDLPELETGQYLVRFFTSDTNITCRLVIHKL